MTQLNKASLAALFQTGDVPSGQNYNDFIDSCVNQVETATQSMAGALNPTELITARVSATNVNVTGILSAATIAVDSITGSAATLRVGTLSAGVVYGDITGSAANFTRAGINTVSATTVITTTVSADAVYASAGRFTSGIYQGVGIVSAAGSAQATAAVLTNVINRGKGVVDGQTTGWTPPANRTGLVQYLFNEGASANLWPPSGGTINGLAANAPFPLAASAMVTIVHLTASAMAAK